jgi:AmmeMemoRadiSam system protein B
MDRETNLRPSPIAGTWYSGDAGRLSRQVDDFLQQAKLPELTGEVVGVIAPHAGFRYSGRTAGHAFRSVLGKQYELVAVISPLHGFHPASLLTTTHDGYETPLGTIPVARQAVAELDEILRREAKMELTAVSRDQEHSLEIELPFLQLALSAPFELLPVMVRSRSSQVIEALGKALAKVFARRPGLLVASTDLSHFHPEEIANRMDSEMLRQIEAFSPEGVLDAERSGSGSACGAFAVAAVLWAARDLGANAIQILHHSTSGEETGDHSEVVGYGAAVILKT